jgi:hypothetical protein
VDVFLDPAGIFVIDEYIPFWTKVFSCPRLLSVTRKKWPFGNEYHTACYELSKIIFQVQLVGGPMQYYNMGKTAGFILATQSCFGALEKFLSFSVFFASLKG